MDTGEQSQIQSNTSELDSVCTDNVNLRDALINNYIFLGNQMMNVVIEMRDIEHRIVHPNSRWNSADKGTHFFGKDLEFIDDYNFIKNIDARP